jgi:uncharacterized protein YwgA
MAIWPEICPSCRVTLKRQVTVYLPVAHMNDEVRREAVSWVIRTLGLTAHDINDSVLKRLVIQKSVHLLSHVGVDEPKFSFSFYIMGPYSPSLTSIYYNLAGEGDTAIAKLARKVGKKMKPYAKLIKWYGGHKAPELEILSSVLMLCDNARMTDESLDKERILNLMKMRKPWVTNEMFEKAYGELEEKGLLTCKA